MLEHVTRLPAALKPVLTVLEQRFGRDRNYLLGVLNGWFVFAGDGFMNASIVLSSFAAALGAPNTVIGLLPAIQTGGWMVPQLLVASRIRHIPRKVTVYQRAGAIRTVSYGLIIVSSVLLWWNPTLLLIAFLIGLTANSLASGVSGLPWMEITAKVIPARQRPGFFAARNLYGGLLALGAGFVVRLILGSSLNFPFDYTLIFALGMIAHATGWWLFGFIDESPDPQQQPVRFRDEVRSIPQTIREDQDFAAFLAYRLMVGVATLSDPFFTVYALRELGVGKANIGTFLIVLGIVAPLSNAIWARLAERFGSRRIIRYAIACAALAPLAALLMQRGVGLGFALVFAFSSVATAGLNMGNTNFMLGVARPEARGRYIGTTNTLVGMAMFTSVLGGQLADRIGYRPVFALGVGLYMVSWFLAGRLRRDL
jgi:predicted MFS family arabinose efflux permease